MFTQKSSIPTRGGSPLTTGKHASPDRGPGHSPERGYDEAAARGRAPTRGGIPGRGGSGRGGASPSRGGANHRMGGASPGRGGASPSRGGANQPAVGGASPVRGGASPTTAGGGRVIPGGSPEGKSEDMPHRGGASPGRPGPVYTTAIGVRYITEDLIKKVSKEDTMGAITSVNLTLSKEGGKKIKYIENLEKLKKCQVLNLSCNMIEKMEKLEKLTQLRELNLAYNKLTKIEGVETLTSLQVLNVTGNEIEHIPAWVGKKLKSLRTFKVAKNQLQSLQELSKLRPLKDLSQLTVSDNPVAQLSHCRAYLVFHMRTLEGLDGQPITWQERNAANTRFSQEELDKLEHRLEKQEQEFSQLDQEHNKSLHEMELTEQHKKETQEQMKRHQALLKDLKMELETKNDLLKKKTVELSKACQKHYELEQELAFYKIDHKFDTLSRPLVDSDGSELADGEGLFGESPYIGKGRFKQNELAREHHLHGAQAQQAQQGHGQPQLGIQVASQSQRASAASHLRGGGGSSGGGGGLPSRAQDSLYGSYNSGSGEIASLGSLDTETREKMHSALDKELTDKQQAVDRAQDRLEKLQRELHATEHHLSRAGEELHKMAEATPGKALTEDDKQSIRDRMTRKMTTVHGLQGSARDIESDIQKTQDEIKRQETGVAKLRGKLRRMGSKDSLYNVVKQEVADKEMQLDMTTQQYLALQRQLEEMLTTIARETESIKHLEQELRDGLAVQNDEIKDELQAIIGGLQSYLSDVQQKADGQRLEHEALLGEREELILRLQDLEADREVMEDQATEISQLRERIADLEDSIQEHCEDNESLRNHLDDVQKQEADDADVSLKLHQAEDVVDNLQGQLDEAQKMAKAERDAYEKKMDAEQKKTAYLKDRVREGNAKEDEIRNLHKQLRELQKSNAGFQDQLYALQQRALEEQRRAVNPEDLRRRLDDVTRVLGLKKGKTEPKSTNTEDPIGEALGDMAEKIQKELDKSFQNVERAKRDKERADAEVVALKDEVVQVQEREREMAEQAIQAMMDDERRETEHLQRELHRLQQELQRARAAAREQPIPPRLLQPSSTPPHRPRDRHSSSGRAGAGAGAGTATAPTTTTTAANTTATTAVSSSGTSETSGEDSSTIHTSQWSRKRRELYEDMNPEEQELFDELQSEIDELRRLLAMNRGKDAADMAAQASQTASHLRDLIESRATSARSSRAELRKISNSTKASTSEDPKIRKVAKELDRAQNEIEALQSQLGNTNPRLRDQMVKSDKSQHTVVAQQQEIDQLHDLLDDQRSEILKLNDLLDDLTGHDPGGRLHPGYDDQLMEVQRGAADLRSSLAEQYGPRVHQLAPPTSSVYPPPSAAYPVGPQVAPPAAYPVGPQMAPLAAYPAGPQMAPLEQQQQQQLQQQPLGMHSQATYQYPEQLGGGGGPTDQGVYAGPDQAYTYDDPRSAPQGRPLPTFYGATEALPRSSLQQDATSAKQYYPQGQPQLHPQSLLPRPQGADGGSGVGMSGAHGYPQVPMPGSLTSAHVHGGTGMAPPSGVQFAGQPAGLEQGAGQAVPMATGHGQLLPDMGGAGVVGGYGPAVYPTTPTRHPPLRTPGSQGHVISAPTTPIAGSGMGTVLSAPVTPNAGGSQPMMMSTPLDAELLGGGGPLKGILKKGADKVDTEAGELVCTVPEHHDLEDYIAKLQQKVRSLKNRLRDVGAGGEESITLDDSRLNTTHERKAVRHLQAELDERRRELEGLDLAIERQKSHLHKMKQTGEVLISEREKARRELQRLRGGRSHGAGRKAFLDGADDYDILESDLDYEYDPRSSRSRSGYLQEEVDCLERTLAKRRAELRAADKLLQECETDLAEARTEAQQTLKSYADAKSGFQTTMRDAEEIERRAHESGVTLVRTDEQLQLLQLETADLQQEKEQQERLLIDIHKIIGNKDAEFQNVDAKVKQATQRLQKLQQDLQSADGQERELDNLNQKVCSGRQELAEVDRQLGQGRAELQLLEDTIDKRHAQREVLDGQVENEITVKRKQIQDLDKHLGDLQTERRQVEQDLAKEERELERLRADNRRHTDTADQLRHQVSLEEATLDTLTNQKQALEGTVTHLRQENGLLEGNHTDLHVKVTELRKTHGQLEDSIHGNHAKLTRLDNELCKVEAVLDGVSVQRSRAEQELQESRHELSDIQSHLLEAQNSSRHLELALSEARLELSLRRDELVQVESTLHSLKRDADSRGHTVDQFSNLEERVRKLADDLCQKTEAREKLTAELAQSRAELQRLHAHAEQEREDMGRHIKQLEAEVRSLNQEVNERSQELQHFREKAASEICDLEGIAQAHCSRANRLSDEMSYLRAEYMEVKRQLDSQQEIAEREKSLQDTLRDLKSDIKYEVTDHVIDAGKSRLLRADSPGGSDLQQLHSQKDSLEHQLSTLKNTLSAIRGASKGGMASMSDDMKNSFLEEQQRLKQQLNQKMTRHAQSMESQQELSRNSLAKLKRKLANLEQVLSVPDGVHLSPVSDEMSVGNRPSSAPVTCGKLSAAKSAASDSDDIPSPSNSQELPSPSAKEVPKRAYSPHRHSKNRSPRVPLSGDSSAPAIKDPTK